MNKAELTVQDIIRSLFSHLLIIILAGILFGVGAWFYTSRYVPKMYRASITFYAVSNTQKTSQDSITSSEQTASRQLASTYSYIVKSNLVMKAASEELQKKGINYSFNALKGMTTVATTNTEIFTATISTSDRKNIKTIADTIADAVVLGISDIVASGEAKILDYAEEPTGPYEPNVRSRTISFALIGVLLASAIVIIHDVTDTTVWSEEDLAKRYNIPVLGSVPQIAAVEKSAEKE